MDHFALLTPHEQLIETVLHIGQWTQGMFNQEFMNSLWITGGPPGPRWESLF